LTTHTVGNCEHPRPTHPRDWTGGSRRGERGAVAELVGAARVLGACTSPPRRPGPTLRRFRSPAGATPLPTWALPRRTGPVAGPEGHAGEVNGFLG